MRTGSRMKKATAVIQALLSSDAVDGEKLVGEALAAHRAKENAEKATR